MKVYKEFYSCGWKVSNTTQNGMKIVTVENESGDVVYRGGLRERIDTQRKADEFVSWLKINQLMM